VPRQPSWVSHLLLTLSSGFPNLPAKGLGVLQHQPVRDSQYVQTHHPQPPILRAIFPHLRGLRVYTSVKLDHQPGLGAVEIHHKPAQGALPAEFQAPDVSIAQQPPSRGFRRGALLAQFTEAFCGSGYGVFASTMWLRPPPPRPPGGVPRLRDHPLPRGERAVSR
jgi:hypothetical protein